MSFSASGTVNPDSGDKLFSSTPAYIELVPQAKELFELLQDVAMELAGYFDGECWCTINGHANTGEGDQSLPSAQVSIGLRSTSAGGAENFNPPPAQEEVLTRGEVKAEYPQGEEPSNPPGALEAQGGKEASWATVPANEGYTATPSTPPGNPDGPALTQADENQQSGAPTAPPPGETTEPAGGEGGFTGR